MTNSFTPDGDIDAKVRLSKSVVSLTRVPKKTERKRDFSVARATGPMYNPTNNVGAHPWLGRSSDDPSAIRNPTKLRMRFFLKLKFIGWEVAQKSILATYLPASAWLDSVIRNLDVTLSSSRISVVLDFPGRVRYSLPSLRHFMLQK